MSSRRRSVWSAAKCRLGFEANLLRRPSDRLQARARIIVFCFFLLGCLVAVFAGRAAYHQQMDRASSDERAGYQVGARVQSTALSAADPQSGATQRVVNVYWLDAQAVRHTQHLVVPDGRKVGKAVSVWVDGSGHASLTKPPRSRTLATGIGVGFLVVFVAVFLAVCAYALVVLALNRQRMRAWQREWSVVEPEWRRRVLGP